MPNHHKVHELLSSAELAELEVFAREPGRTVDECWQWMTEPPRSFDISRGAVGNWKAAFEAQCLSERFSRSGELARAIKGAVAGGNLADVADAAAMQLTQVVFEQSARMEADGEIDPLSVMRMTRSLANLVGSKRALEELKKDVATAIDEAAKVAKGGASGEEVIGKVREILGIGGAR